jgi:hypothetical protein
MSHLKWILLNLQLPLFVYKKEVPSEEIMHLVFFTHRARSLLEYFTEITGSCIQKICYWEFYLLIW